MKYHAFVLFVLVLASVSHLPAQTFTGDTTLSTQAAVDGFSYTSVTGNLTIFGGGITNLGGLSGLQSIGGGLEITNTALTNIDGLANLTSVGLSVLVRGNSILPNLNGFSGLTSVGRGLFFLGNNSLTDFDGLLSLTSTIEGIRVSACPMTNLHGFSNVFDLTGYIELEDNPNLVEFDALQGLQGADDVNSIKINHNPLLQNIDGLSSIKKAEGIQIIGNHILPNIDGLANLTDVASMIISDNPALVNIGGLVNIQSMSGSLWIRSNSSLADVNGLGNLTTIGKEFIIDGDYSLAQIDGLTSLTSIGTNLIISLNSQLVDLNGLQNLTNVGNDLNITINSHLVDFCGLTTLFTSGTIGGTINITRNGANTVTIASADVTVNADQGVCSAVVSDAAIGDPVSGCLPTITKSHTDFPAGNIFPVGTTDITWSATDGANNSVTGVQHITVVDNQPPVITSCPANITVSCASDVPAADSTLVSATDNCSVTVTHAGDVITNQTCANRFTLTRTYKATDPAGNSDSCSQVITVNDNTPPQITGLTLSQSVLWPPNHTMRDITVNYTVSDNCITDLGATITVGSNEPVNGTGDGDTDPDWVVVDAHHIQLRAERSANGTGRLYTVTVTATDGCNDPVSTSAQVMVTHNITAPLSGKAFKVGSTVGFAGEFQDNPANTHTAQWLIDGKTSVKGTVTEPAASKNGSVTGSYKFGSAGVYKLQMNTTDQKGTVSYANTNGDLEEIVVIYDPSGGYTVGGGWFPSPAGSLATNPSLAGKVSFGFALSYFKNATYPKGETQFQFNLGGLEFNATNFNYLAISGGKAQFKGSGKVYGDAASYNFLLTLIDGQAAGGDGVDKIRMKIYNKNTNLVVYDNQPGASDAADPMTAVGGGSSITIAGIGATGASAAIDRNETREGPGEVCSLPTEYGLNQNYPNPFNPATMIEYQLPVSSIVKLQVFNTMGQVVATLFDGAQEAGYREARWDAGEAASGVYFYKLEATSTGDMRQLFTRVRKMVLLK